MDSSSSALIAAVQAVPLTTSLCGRWRSLRCGVRRGHWTVVAMGLLLLLPMPKATGAPLPYGQAVSYADRASQAVLSRAGRETCLRGKLTRALLQLSDSCQAQGVHNGLCTLADEAVVVTPMSLSFMDETSRQLQQQIKLQASQAGSPSAAAAAGSDSMPKAP